MILSFIFFFSSILSIFVAITSSLSFSFISLSSQPVRWMLGLHGVAGSMDWVAGGYELGGKSAVLRIWRSCTDSSGWADERRRRRREEAVVSGQWAHGLVACWREVDRCEEMDWFGCWRWHGFFKIWNFWFDFSHGLVGFGADLGVDLLCDVGDED